MWCSKKRGGMCSGLISALAQQIPCGALMKSLGGTEIKGWSV